MSEHQPISNEPTEEQLAKLLESLKHEPSTRFYAQLHAAPWGEVHRPQSMWKSMVFGHRLMAVATLAFVFTAVSLMILPSLSAIAETANEWLEYMQRADSDEKVITYRVPQYPVSYNEQQEAINDGYIFSTDQASKIAGFEVRVPTLLPDAYRFRGARAEKDFVELRYDSVNAVNPTNFQIRQWRADGVTQYEVEVGESASIEQVKIGNLIGEYVEGHWSLKSSNLYGRPEPGAIVKESYRWDNRGGATLIWRENNLMYTLQPSQRMLKEDLFSVARCMYMPYEIREPAATLQGHRRQFASKNISCNLTTQQITQTFVSPQQLLVFRQQPAEQNSENTTYVVDGEIIDIVRFQTAYGLAVSAEITKGTWLGSLPPTVRLNELENTVIGIRWKSRDRNMVYELWIVGTGRGASRLDLATLIDIAETVY